MKSPRLLFACALIVAAGLTFVPLSAQTQVWHWVNGVLHGPVPLVVGPLTVSSTAVTSTVPLVMSSTPAQSGTIRLGFGQKIVSRSGADDGDIDLFYLGLSNYIYAGRDLAPAGVYDFGSSANQWRDGYFSRNLIFGSAGSVTLASKAFINTAPTLPVACTSPTIVNSNGTATFEIDVGTTCAGISTLAVTMPAVTNGYGCTATNLTTSATAAVEMTASTTTSITLTNYTRTTGVALAWADGANVRVSCTGG
jgi:hypothetical protein